MTSADAMYWKYLAVLVSIGVVYVGVFGIALRRLTATGTRRKWLVRLVGYISPMLVALLYAFWDFHHLRECRVFPTCLERAAVWYRLPGLFIDEMLLLVIVPEAFVAGARAVVKILDAPPRWVRLFPKRRDERDRLGLPRFPK